MIGTNVYINYESLTTDGAAELVLIGSNVKIKAYKPYKKYPVLHYSNEKCQAYFEGVCFVPEVLIRTWINELFDLLINGEMELQKAVVNRFWEAGGEYACWIFYGDYLFFFNDYLGRLPVYEWHFSKKYFIGRSLGCLFYDETKKSDAVGLAQYIWAGYSIAGRTIYSNVSYISPGTIQIINTFSGQIQQRFQTEFDFSFRNHVSIKKNAQKLNDLFLDGCSRMSSALGVEWHLSLSGGQDSRAVLAGMNQRGVTISASSFRMAGAQKDADIAQQLAKLAKVPWQVFDISESIEECNWIIDLKQGLNYVEMAFIAEYLSAVAMQFPHSILLTGDGGDVALPYFGEFRNPGSLDHLVDTLLKRHAITPAPLAASLFGLKKDELAQSVYQLVSTYPETRLNDRSIHFAVFERIAKAYFEGEDRNRFFLWSTTPFYDPSFFGASMEVPDNQKKYYKLYKHFMQVLAPAFYHLPDAGGGKIGDIYFHARKFVRENFRSTGRPLKASLKSLNELLSGDSIVKQRMTLGLPESINEINEGVWMNLQKKESYQTYLHMLTLAKTFS